MYASKTIREYLDAVTALEAVPPGQDYLEERSRLDQAEDNLLAEGWKNLETRQQLEAILLESTIEESTTGVALNAANVADTCLRGSRVADTGAM